MISLEWKTSIQDKILTAVYTRATKVIANSFPASHGPHFTGMRTHHITLKEMEQDNVK
jgi:hypothetical protein